MIMMLQDFQGKYVRVEMEWYRSELEIILLVVYKICGKSFEKKIYKYVPPSR